MMKATNQRLLFKEKEIDKKVPEYSSVASLGVPPRFSEKTFGWEYFGVKFLEDLTDRNFILLKIL